MSPMSGCKIIPVIIVVGVFNLLAACTATRQATLQITGPPLPSPTSPSPTDIQQETPTPITSPEPAITPSEPAGMPVVPCLQVVDSFYSDTGQLRVVFTARCVTVGGLGDVSSDLWLWREETDTAEAYPLPAGAVTPRLSADHQLILFRKFLSETESELWVIGVDGGGERMLARVSYAEAMQRNPEATFFDLEYAWLKNTRRVVYRVSVGYDLGLSPYDTVFVVDAGTGEERVIVLPGEVYWLVYSPAGDQAAALTFEELRLIDTRTGQVQFSIALSGVPYSNQPQSYAPDGAHALVFGPEKIFVIDAQTGALQEIPLAFSPWGVGDAPAHLPGVYWLDGSSFYTVVVNLEGEEDFFFPEATFTVWEVDLSLGEARSISTFKGIVPNPDYYTSDLERLIYFHNVELNNPVQELNVADIRNGEDRLYATGTYRFSGWNMDNAHFLIQAEDGTLYLGGFDQELTLLPVPSTISSIRWVDAQRFLAIEYDDAQELRLYTLDGESILISSGG